MVIILAIAICTSNIIKYGTSVNVRTMNTEGLENKKDGDTKMDTKKEEGLTEQDQKTTTTTTKNDTPDDKDTDVQVVKRKASGGDPQPVTERSKLDPAKVKEARIHLKEITNLHNTITRNMESMEASLKSAEKIFDKVKDGFDNIVPNKA